MGCGVFPSKNISNCLRRPWRACLRKNSSGSQGGGNASSAKPALQIWGYKADLPLGVTNYRVTIHKISRVTPSVSRSSCLSRFSRPSRLTPHPLRLPLFPLLSLVPPYASLSPLERLR